MMLPDHFRGALGVISGVAVTAAACLPLGYCVGHRAGISADAVAEAQVDAEIREIDGRAQGNAAEDRVSDAVAADRMERELINAIAQVPDDEPSRIRVAAGCQRLRGQGTAEADLPPVCRP